MIGDAVLGGVLVAVLLRPTKEGTPPARAVTSTTVASPAADPDEPAALEFFESLGKTKRYRFLYRIADAKRPETRAKRIAESVALLAKGKAQS